MVDEKNMLKAKINGVIDKINELNDVLKTKEIRIEQLKQEIAKLQNVGPEAISEYEENDDEILQFMQDFCIVGRIIIEREDYIPYTYETKYSEKYYKIKQEVFDNCICNYARLDLRTFVNYCIDLCLIKSEKNRKCVYPSAEIRVYYVSRDFLNAIKNRSKQGAE